MLEWPMKDMFDEFMDELRRRQAGEEPRGQDDRQPDRDPEDDDDRDDDDGDERAQGDRRDDDRDRGRPGGPPPPPRPIRREGGGGPSLRRQVFTILAFVIAFALIVFVVIGVDLWTDAIWYTSVGYDEVFWRRLWVQVGLFA